MAVGFPTKVSYANGDVFSASDINDTNGTINLLGQSVTTSAGKNAIINGGFDVWQRGTTSASITSTITYTADRWAAQSGASTAITVSRQATSDTTNLPTIQYCSRVQRTAGQTGTSFVQLSQSMESVNCVRFAGQAITVSFYARRGANYSAASNALSVLMLTGTGTDQQVLVGYTGSVSAISSSATLTTTWQRFTFTATLATNTNEIGLDLYYTPVGTAGANDYFEVTGVQLELGTATTFARSGSGIQGEIAACQRYYWRFTGPGVYSAYGFGAYGTTTVGYILLDNPVTLRTAPTSLDYANLAVQLTDGATPVALTNLVVDQNSLKNTTLQFTVGTAGTAFRPCRLLNNNNAAGYVGLSAEL
jgi:hypothetical protein